MATLLKLDHALCTQGAHRPKRVPVRNAGETIRTTCRDCGCTLIRTQATRRWIYSGPLS